MTKVYQQKLEEKLNRAIEANQRLEFEKQELSSLLSASIKHNTQIDEEHEAAFKSLLNEKNGLEDDLRQSEGIAKMIASRLEKSERNAAHWEVTVHLMLDKLIEMKR